MMRVEALTAEVEYAAAESMTPGNPEAMWKSRLILFAMCRCDDSSLPVRPKTVVRQRLFETKLIVTELDILSGTHSMPPLPLSPSSVSINALWLPCGRARTLHDRGESW
jgi:hypothetical protein